MKLLNNQYARIEFFERENYMKLTWKKSAPHEQHQRIITQCLKSLEILDCHKLLSDIRNIGLVKAWIEQEWLDLANEKGLDDLAYVIKAQTYKTILSKKGNNLKCNVEGITNHMFRNEVVAERWLLSAS